MLTVIAPVARVLLVIAALGFVVQASQMNAGSGSQTPRTSYASDGFDWH
jgi:hypothetical protein